MGVLGHLWWLIPAAIVLCAVLAAFLGPGATVVAAWAKSAPRAVWLAMAGVMVLGFSFQCGRWHERSVAQERQEAAEKRADAKAERVARKAAQQADAARKRFEKESVVNEHIREVVRYLHCDPLPDGVRDALQRKVEAARDPVPAD